MNAPWFDPHHCGGLQGMIFGLWGAWLGISSGLVYKGEGWPLVLGLGVLLDAICAVVLTGGLIALASGQPFGVWINLVGPGLLGGFVTTATLLRFRKRYREAVERHRRDEHRNEELTHETEPRP